MSGKIVDMRDHVLTMVRWLAWFMASMRDISRSSTHGPFLLLRDISGSDRTYVCRPGGRRRRLARTPTRGTARGISRVEDTAGRRSAVAWRCAYLRTGAPLTLALPTT